MDPSSSDWTWYPDIGLYYSPRTQAYARPNPYAPTGWEYIPTANTSQSQPSEPRAAVVEDGQRKRADYSDLLPESSNDAEKQTEPQPEMEREGEGEGGGIGNVGWGLDFVLPGEEPSKATDSTQGNAHDTIRNQASEPSGAMVSARDASGIPTAIKPTTTPPKHPTSLRLVKLAPLSSSSPLSTTENLAILDARPSGYILGRDRHISKPVLRLKELAVSKVHATVWFGWRGKDLGELLRDDKDTDRVAENENENEKGEAHQGERRFWIVDCGSTHGTFLRPFSTAGSDKKISRAEETHRLSPARTSSRPVPLNHLDRLIIGSMTFECHLHPDWPCETCAMTDPGSIIPLAEAEDGKMNGTSTTYVSVGTTAAASSTGIGSDGIPTVPGNWKETEERRIALTAEAKRADTHRRSALAMRKLRESYFGRGGGGGGGGDGDSEKTNTGGKRKWGSKADGTQRESDDGWKKKRAGDGA